MPADAAAVLASAAPSVVSGVVMLLVGWFAAAAKGARQARADERADIERLLGLYEEVRADAGKREALYKGMKASLRKDLVDAYRDHVTEGKPLTVERMHEITEGYNAYRALGGNGTGKAMYEGICEVPIAIVK